jgi:hypothetical protein
VRPTPPLLQRMWPSAWPEVSRALYFPFAFHADLMLVADSAIEKHEELFFNAARLDRSTALRTADYMALAKPRMERIVPFNEAHGNRRLARIGTVKQPRCFFSPKFRFVSPAARPPRAASLLFPISRASLLSPTNLINRRQSSGPALGNSTTPTIEQIRTVSRRSVRGPACVETKRDLRPWRIPPGAKLP